MAKKKINPCIYSDISVNDDFSRAVVQNDTHLYGLVELPSFKEIVPFKYASMKQPREGYCVVSLDGKWGAIDMDGNEVIPLVYENMNSFCNGRAGAMRDGKAGVIDTQGNVLTDFVYDRMPPMDIMCYDLWEMKKDGACGMIDKYGNEIVPFKYISCEIWENADGMYIRASKTIKDTNGEIKLKYALYDMKGKELLPLKYPVAEYHNGYIIAGDDSEHCGVLDLDGNVLVPFEHDQRGSSIDVERGYFLMTSNDSEDVTIYNLKGEKILTLPYDSAYPQNNAILVYDGDNCGLCDYQGKLLIQVVNEYLVHLDGDRYIAQIHGAKEASLIDLSSGKTTILPYGIHYKLDDLFIVTADGKFGVLNNRLETVIPIIYDHIGPQNYSDKSFVVYREGQTAVFDSLGHIIKDFGQETAEATFLREYDRHSEYAGKGYLVEKKKKYGLLDISGNPLGLPIKTAENKPKKKKVPSPICPFKEVRNFSEGFAAVRTDDGWGYIDRHGNLLHTFVFSRASDFKDGLAKVDGMGRYINTKGEIEYHFEPYISDSVREPGYLYSKTEDGKRGWVDHEGNYVVPCIYDSDNRSPDVININEDHLQYIKVKLNDKSGVYDLHGNLILEVEHDYLTKLDIGYWHSRVDRKYALYSPDGRRQTEHKYDYIGECYGNLLTVKVNGKEGVINLVGKEIVPAEYDRVSISKQGHYVVLRRDWKYGMIDSEGREICPLKYDSLGDMDEQTGMAAACISRNHGYIDTEGKEIIPLKYADTGDFHLGFAVVQVHGSKLYGVINAKGEEVMPIQYTDVCLSDYVNEELRIVKIYDENKVGIFDLLGSKELIAPRYADVGKYSEGWLAVKSRGKWGFVDKEGYPLKYEWLK